MTQTGRLGEPYEPHIPSTPHLSTMAILTWRAESVMMQKRVISEAVPAVVLMDTSGSMGLLLTSTPCDEAKKPNAGRETSLQGSSYAHQQPCQAARECKSESSGRHSKSALLPTGRLCLTGIELTGVEWLTS